MCKQTTQIRTCLHCHQTTTQKMPVIACKETPLCTLLPLSITLTLTCPSCLSHHPYPQTEERTPSPEISLPIPPGPPPNYAETTTPLPTYNSVMAEGPPIPYVAFQQAHVTFSPTTAIQKWWEVRELQQFYISPIATKISSLQAKLGKLDRKCKNADLLRVIKTQVFILLAAEKEVIGYLAIGVKYTDVAETMSGLLEKERENAVNAAKEHDFERSRQCVERARKLEEKLFEVHVEAGRVNDPRRFRERMQREIVEVERQIWGLEVEVLAKGSRLFSWM